MARAQVALATDELVDDLVTELAEVGEAVFQPSAETSDGADDGLELREEVSGSEPGEEVIGHGEHLAELGRLVVREAAAEGDAEEHVVGQVEDALAEVDGRRIWDGGVLREVSEEAADLVHTDPLVRRDAARREQLRHDHAPHGAVVRPRRRERHVRAPEGQEVAAQEVRPRRQRRVVGLVSAARARSGLEITTARTVPSCRRSSGARMVLASSARAWWGMSESRCRCPITGHPGGAGGSRCSGRRPHVVRYKYTAETNSDSTETEHTRMNSMSANSFKAMLLLALCVCMAWRLPIFIYVGGKRIEINVVMIRDERLSPLLNTTIDIKAAL